MRKTTLLLTLLLTLVLPGAAARAATAAPEPTLDAIRTKLLRLPYYGVFDFLVFSYQDGTVTLGGYAYTPGLKLAAERAVQKVDGVKKVVDEIEVLPASINDDDIRWRTYFAIYDDPFFTRYVPNGGLLWGHKHRVPFGRFLFPTRFPGEEPLGNYPIAIIVKNGRITLMGVVDREADKTVAGLKAGQVPGAFGVENDLEVDPGH